MGKNSSMGRKVQAVEITCEVIEALELLNGAGVTEIANHIGRSKATVHGHLATLWEHELVVEKSGEYRLGFRFLDLGTTAKQELDIYPVVTEEADRLAERTGEVGQFMIEEQGRGVYIYREQGENAVETASYPGKREYLHCTALGKAILSTLPDRRIESIVQQHGLPSRTENTITTEERLFEEIEEIRERGIAIDHEEFVEGLRCVAAPICVSLFEGCSVAIHFLRSRAVL